ncbi:hypothetical protein BH11GEM2_BH11GEM2_26490 [soil metagenome]|jgi:hypothetical protein
MPYNDTTHAAAKVQRDALRIALVTFATATLPAAGAACAAAVIAMDPGHPMLDGSKPEDVRFYRACVQYVNELIAAGRYAGPPLRFP